MSTCKIIDDSCGWTDDDYFAAIQQNLPRGPIWDLSDETRVISRFWRAIASGFAACAQYLCDILAELFPCTAVMMLGRWAAIFGYPSDCPAPGLTAERLCEWIQLQDSPCAGPTLEYLQQVAEWLGYPAATLAEWGVPQSSMGCGQIGCMQVGGSPDAPALHGCRQFLLVSVNANADTDSAEMGCGEMGCNDMSSGNCAPPVATRYAQIGSCNFQLGCTPICGADPPPMMCLISKFVPAHVCVMYKEF
ncbi:hypothetical protein KY49_730 [Burkholderia sp. MSHR3999]|uniref:hypothetical protein n=1 Tax=Burkholderia sp. MSHR3999 TaxID=1542965 RepID=UPI0005AC5AF4|nr:hypothetical protein [Burkholderia sp. MSHR3999]KIP14286.1 hypothetical protein KY49_730 [Burkholderia sp. MSHR3999]